MNDFQYSWEESVKRKKKSAERQNIMDYSQNNSTSICRDFSSYIENELQFVLSKVRKGQMMNSTTFLTMKNKRSLNDKNRSPIYDSSYLNNFNNQFANGNTTNQVVGPKKWNNDEEYNVYFIERNRTYIKKSDNNVYTGYSGCNCYHLSHDHTITHKNIYKMNNSKNSNESIEMQDRSVDALNTFFK
ncbi:unnamed protein product [Gordionus sp. m RMFG-2023]